MTIDSRLKISVVTLLTLTLASLVWPAHAAIADAGPWAQDQDLAEAYAPVLYFHPDELFRPQPVEVMLTTARLQQVRSFWPDANLLRHVTASDLSHYADSSYNLDAWLGDEIPSDYKNYSAHRTFYQSKLSPEAGGPSTVAYAHIVRDEDPHHITIQYWLFYWYNDAFNKHEGDWEMVQVVLSAASEPEWIVLTQHHGGTRRSWSTAQIEGGTHPAVYVALGSHANYFWGNEVYLNGMTIGNTRVEIADRTGTIGRTVPDIALIPGRDEIKTDPIQWAGFEWLLFCGHWGEGAPQRDFGGPLGPADKGDQWELPHAWGMAQPLDTDTWYANRLRVEVIGHAGDSARVTLRAAGMDRLPLDETGDGLALLHADPTPGAAILADIEARPGQLCDIIATWPDAGTSQVIRYRFDNAPLGAEGRATLALRADEPPVLMVAGVPHRFQPTATGTTAVTWDAPDVIWTSGLLPAADLLRGVALSLLAGLLPVLLYTGLLRWVNQYKREPVRLLGAAFLWGAVPALLVALVVRVFFQLPDGLLEPRITEMVSTGLVAPLIEQTLTGAAVLLIAWRYRREIDETLDGIIYGAVVGFGFAMTANTLSYLGAFLQYGFAGLGYTVFIDGVLYGLNQALYAAILGAGLGYARLAPQRWQHWAVPLAAFVLAVATRAFHNLAIDSTTGWSLQTIAVTWAGLLVIVAVMVWSLHQRRRCLAVELAGEVPDTLFHWLTTPGGCWLAEWWALRRGGLHSLVQLRLAFRFCAKLAFTKMQSRQPGETGAAGEVHLLRQEVETLMDGALLRLAI